MSYARLATRLYNVPLLVTQAHAVAVERAFQTLEQRGERAALEVPQPKRVEDERMAIHAAEAASVGTNRKWSRADQGYFVSSDGIALIPVVGTLVQRGGYMDALCGFVSYGLLQSQYAAALADSRVDAVLFELDTPGGEANGVMPLADDILAGSERKPTWAIANEQAFSAGYWIASAADRLYVPQTGMVGSVGVVALHVDQSIADTKRGYVYTPIFAGERKVDFNSHAPLTDSARALAQQEVDRLYELFVGAVAKGRNVSAKAVRATQAGLLNPEDAVDQGFADGVASFHETLAELAAEAKRARYGMALTGPRARAAHIVNEGEEMDQANSNKAPTFSAEDVNKARTDGAAEATQKAELAAKDAAKAAGAAAQKRVAAILGHEEAQGREAFAKRLAFETDRPVDECVADLKATPKENAGKAPNRLAAAMERVPNPNVDAGAGDADKAKPVINASDIYARRRQQAGHAPK